ncbi:thermonuclease family protein [Gemella bergeri ATCC 700627]|uniref:Thermonuclease family protein n=1 Tax=Gemella bergeri ATCC 700627 TaxID=1321820 RepID=U2QVP1_9BACL|nr:thermonuclease family protein [Gemella bergeri]ERK60616.1 thermonuclease family protein [Gemella bergeri ATCC 700627]
MNKKIFIICIGIFSTIFLILFFIFNTHFQEKYNKQIINDVEVKGDTTKYKVNFVEKIDGDTIVVRFNKKNLKVRYLLIDTPETVKRGVAVQPYGPEASELNEKLLKNAQNIEIEFDVYQKEDKYHRALCYVYADGKSIQEELLLSGLAEIKYVKAPDTRYLNKFKKAQNIAKSNKRNLWSN